MAHRSTMPRLGGHDDCKREGLWNAQSVWQEVLVANLHADLSPVVVLVLEVVERRVVAAALWRVGGCGHTCIPLSDKVRGVSVRGERLWKIYSVARN